jgi:hypothetical protein
MLADLPAVLETNVSLMERDARSRWNPAALLRIEVAVFMLLELAGGAQISHTIDGA